MSELCAEHFPAGAELARLAENAQAGRREPFVGTGDPDTVLACADGQWRLGDVITEPKAACQELTKAGEPCKGAPGADGYCAAHKPKEDASAAGDIPPAVVDADPPAQAGGEGEEDDGPQVGG